MKKTILLLAGLILSTHAYALPASEVTTEFYKDASKSILVGETILSCGGGRVTWGRKTAFSQKSSSSCGRLRTSGQSIAATSLLHHDPVFACRMRCQRIPLQICPPPSPEQPDCVQPRTKCEAACQELLTPVQD